MKRRARWLALGLGLALLLMAAVAWARPGGGSSYSGGSSSSGGGSSSDGGEGELFVYLILLCIEHPTIGIPLLVICTVVFLVKKSMQGKQKDWASANASAANVGQTQAARAVTFEPLRAADPGFSRVVFEDFLYSLFAEVHTTRGLPGAPLDRLSAYLTPQATASLRMLPQGRVEATAGGRATAAAGSRVEAVIVGALHLLDVQAGPQGSRIVLSIEANYTEGARGMYVHERWTLQRGPGARSRTPDRVRQLGCPGCGAPQEALFSGQCRHCRRTVNDGSFDWVVAEVHSLTREARPPVLGSHVEEQGTTLPTVVDRDLQRGIGQLQHKDPSFNVDAFQARVGLIHQQFQIAWSARDLQGMRPFMSDALFSVQTYWVQAYLAQRLRNVSERGRITSMQLVKIESDPYFDAITVRFWATGLDYTVSDDGRHVSGSRSKERPYSEYWTLIRGTNRKGAARTDLACSNCGAPLKVNMVGTCTYCKVKVTTGDFDWVLSRIEQDESYRG